MGDLLTWNRARRGGILAALALGLVLALAPAALATPTASFTITPNPPQAGSPATLTSTSTSDDPLGAPLATYAWNIDGTDAGSAASIDYTFPAAGPHTVSLTVTDLLGGSNSTGPQTVNVDPPPPPPNVPPVAAFSVSPSGNVGVGDSVVFNASASSDPDGGGITDYAWDFDDGQTAHGQVVSHKFTGRGSFSVRLTVTDNRGGTDSSQSTVTVVANSSPLASFTFSPDSPVAGQPVTFTSRSSDPDGTIRALNWDFDGDNVFDDAAGATVVRTFPAAGTYTVSLRATDDRGATSVAFQTVAVRGTASPQEAAAAPQPGPSVPNAHPPGSSPSPGTSLMDPFPIVRIRGRIFGSRVQIDLMTVRAPKGATVHVRCRGRHCPRKAKMTARSKSARRTIRLKHMERRYRAGSVIEVSIEQRGRIGKFVRFTIRKRLAPARRDLCIRFHAKRPTRCPGQ